EHHVFNTPSVPNDPHRRPIHSLVQPCDGGTVQAKDSPAEDGRASELSREHQRRSQREQTKKVCNEIFVCEDHHTPAFLGQKRSMKYAVMNLPTCTFIARTTFSSDIVFSAEK